MRKAKDVYTRFGDALLDDKAISGLLLRHRRAVETSWETMDRFGVVRICTVCAGRKAGSCCFNGVEEWYDSVLLLINLLLGAELPDVRKFPNGCLFLGESGCKLAARYYFCINYLCSEIKDSLDPSDLKLLMAVSGQEIQCGIQVERAVCRWLDTR